MMDYVDPRDVKMNELEKVKTPLDPESPYLHREAKKKPDDH